MHWVKRHIEDPWAGQTHKNDGISCLPPKRRCYDLDTHTTSVAWIDDSGLSTVSSPRARKKQNQNALNQLCYTERTHGPHTRSSDTHPRQSGAPVTSPVIRGPVTRGPHLVLNERAGRHW